MRDLPFWVALSKISSLGARRIMCLVEAFGSAEAAFTASFDDLTDAGLSAKAADVLLVERRAIDPDIALQGVKDAGFVVMTRQDRRYPTLLREIYDPPAVLYYRGESDVLNGHCIAIVGSRKATEYGKAAAARLAGDLARAGTVVVSGMARGIDTHAHAGALRAEGKTVAVLGCGLDICYPPENVRLREKIVSQGIVLSEFPPGTKPKPHHFPMRNRIISGLSVATVVVEAAEKSGALITADCALEQGREVFAVPGSINSPASRGCHRLIKEGAAVAENGADILAELGVFSDVPCISAPQMSSLQKRIIDALQYEPIHFDNLCVRANLPAPDLAAVLVELELAGIVKKMPGNYYLRV